MVSLRAKIIFWYLRRHNPIEKKGLNIDEQRISMDKSTSMFKVPKDAIIKRVTIGNIPAEKIYYNESKKERIILYLHGGAYTRGSPKSHRAFVAKLSKITDSQAFTIDYRLAPENPFPAAIEDTIKAYQGIIAENQVSQSNIIIAGDSAGGGLAITSVLKMKEEEIPLPAAVVCISPWTDLTLSGKTYSTNEESDLLLTYDEIRTAAEMYAGEKDKKNPLISPIFADLEGFPPLFIQVGESEMLYDDGIILGKNAKKAGIKVEVDIWEKMIHSFQLMNDFLPEGKKATEKIGSFITDNFS